MSSFCLLALFFFLVAALAPASLFGQSSPASTAMGANLAGSGRILLVLPFDNLTDPTAALTPATPSAPAAGQTATPAEIQPGSRVTEQTNLEWVREAAPEILNSRFTSAGFLPLSSEDRLYALDHLGLPEGFQPSRATALRLAETLDADYIVFGSFTATGQALAFKARVVDVAHLRLLGEVAEMGEKAQMISLLNSLAYKLTRQLDPSFGVAEETFLAAGAKLRLDAFEQYVRGITEPGSAERLRHLKKATDLNPDFAQAWLATGKLQFASQQYEQAAVSFARVTRGDPSELEAGFYRGLALIYSGSYAHAEESFAAVARVLPLPEVVNNEAVALSRRGRDGSPLFRQAEAADPTDADYHFNLAVSLRRHGNKTESVTELGQCLQLRPNDSEAIALSETWSAGAQEAADQEKPAAPDALERIKRSYNGAAFREAALMLDQVEAARLQALPAAQRAIQLSRTAREKLDRGLLLEAEREYQAALTADNQSADAHAGLAEVRERAGDSEAARKEAHAALDRQPNLNAYLVLARLDLAANHFAEAQEDTSQALKLDGTSRTARDLRKTIDAHVEAHPGAEPAAAGPRSGTTGANPPQQE